MTELKCMVPDTHCSKNNGSLKRKSVPEMAQGEKGKTESIQHWKGKDAWKKSGVFHNKQGCVGTGELFVFFLFPLKPGQKEMSLSCNRRD